MNNPRKLVSLMAAAPAYIAYKNGPRCSIISLNGIRPCSKDRPIVNIALLSTQGFVLYNGDDPILVRLAPKRINIGIIFLQINVILLVAIVSLMIPTHTLTHSCSNILYYLKSISIEIFQEIYIIFS